MRILGIDPGLKATGYGFIESPFKSSQKKGHILAEQDITLIETGTIEPKPKDLIQNRLYKIHTILGELIDAHKPQVLVLEKLYAHVKHPITSSILGHVRGVICLLCAQKGVELVEHSPKRIRKAVTGNGNASKNQTKRMVAHRLNIDEQKLTLDASDALALALGFIYIHGRQL